MRNLDESTDLLVLKLEDDPNGDEGHSTFTVHGTTDLVHEVAGLVTGLLAAQAERIGIPGSDGVDELVTGNDEDASLAEAA